MELRYPHHCCHHHRARLFHKEGDPWKKATPAPWSLSLSPPHDDDDDRLGSDNGQVGSSSAWPASNLTASDTEQPPLQNQYAEQYSISSIDPHQSSLSSSPSPPDSAFSKTALSSMTSWIRQNIFLGVEVTPEIGAIMTIYFVEGALGLARLAQTYLLKDELSLGPAQLSALTGIFVLPWTIKPLYGFLSDGFPLWGYRRKTYLMVAGLLGAMSYTLLGYNDFWAHLPSKEAALAGTVAAFLLSSACVAMSDVVADGIVVSQTRRQGADDATSAGSLQSLCWGSAAVGGLISAYFSGSLLEIMSVRNVFGLAAILPLLVALIAFFIDEERQQKLPASADFNPNDDHNDDLLLRQAQKLEEDVPFEVIRGQMQTLWKALRQPSIWRPALFIFLWQSTPTADSAFFFFLTNDLQLGPEFMGRIRLVSQAASLAGVALYNQYFKTVKIKDLLLGSTVVSVPLGMLPLLLITHVNRDWGIPDQALIYGDDVVLTVLGQISFLPTLVLAARLCPPGIEAVLFATLMSIFNGASTVASEAGAVLTQGLGITESIFENLPLLVVICNLSSLFPLLFIGWLDQVGDPSEQDLSGEEAES